MRVEPLPRRPIEYYEDPSGSSGLVLNLLSFTFMMVALGIIIYGTNTYMYDLGRADALTTCVCEAGETDEDLETR